MLPVYLETNRRKVIPCVIKELYAILSKYGFEQKNQDGTVKMASLGLQMTVEIDLLKEQAETNIKEPVKEPIKEQTEKA